ncbi:MAG: hypothetical protein ABID79_05650 [Elusimicrobiota bacterium]
MRKILKSSNWQLDLSMTKQLAILKSFLLALFLSFSFSFYLYSATPNKIKYQGVMKKDGVLVNGTKQMKFRIVDSNNTEYWNSDNKQVLVSQGAFSYTLEPITINDWGIRPYYIEVIIDDIALTPREELTSTVYALQARNIDDGVITTPKIVDGAVTSAKIADGAIANVKISSVSWSKLTDIPGTLSLAGDLSQDTVGTYQIIDSTIATADIADGAITPSKISIGQSYDIKVSSASYADFAGSASGAVDAECRASTGTLRTDLNAVALSTGTLRTELVLIDNEIKVSTGILRTDVYNLQLATGVLNTSKLNLSGGTMTGEIIGSTITLSGKMTATKYYGDGSALTGVEAIAIDKDCRASTGTLRSDLNAVALSTGILRTDVYDLQLATGIFVAKNTVNNSDENPALKILQTGATNAILIQQTATVPAIQVTGGGLLFAGSVGAIPATGSGTRLMWYPAKSAFRAGRTDDTQWDDANISNYSFACGWNTISSNTASVAMGYNTKANGQYSTAMGFGTTASNDYSTAMGYLTTASGYASTAMGNNATVSGQNSTAMGYNTKASGQSSTAMGENTIASGYHSTAMGFCSIAAGSYSTAIGSATVTSGANWSVGIGQNVKSTNYNNIVIGKGSSGTSPLVNNTADSLMVGFNKTTPTFTVFQSSVVVDGTLQCSTATFSGAVSCSSITIGNGTPIIKYISVTVLLDFPAVPQNENRDIYVNIQGANPGDTVILGPPNILANINSTCFTSWVSNDNTVTVRFNNYGGISTGDPDSYIFRITVIKH